MRQIVIENGNEPTRWVKTNGQYGEFFVHRSVNSPTTWTVSHKTGYMATTDIPKVYKARKVAKLLAESCPPAPKRINNLKDWAETYVLPILTQEGVRGKL